MSPSSQRRREDGRLAVFLAVVLAVGVGYTAMAFAMEWRTAAGRIGAGFFPRIVGLGIVLLTAVSLARAVYRLRLHRAGGSPEGAAGEQAGAGSSVFVRTACVLVVLLAGLTAVLLPLGAVVASILFLLAALYLLNPGRHTLNISVSFAVPIALYVLFQLVLNAGLPAGVVPVQ